MKSKFSTSFLVFLYIFIDLIFMENVSIDSSEIFFVQFTYHLNMNEQKRPIKTTKIIFPRFMYFLLQSGNSRLARSTVVRARSPLALLVVLVVMLWYRDVV